ncbi:uncharacterized protein SOCE836_063040 [Sorangium cellulosum]|uniref:Uncharacterized protein n=1 Tax=Sorangium cellulosum TaxID=56 RepID=A0A4P2QVF2_SORCE|nr:uncharacterized protein SOCE836_063040 [Sorangium cellulosum]WCQ93447.1 hypothetical protein NQZ70_06196 [Sorangium sp. Soce836]
MVTLPDAGARVKLAPPPRRLHAFERRSQERFETGSVSRPPCGARASYQHAVGQVAQGVHVRYRLRVARESLVSDHSAEVTVARR